MKTILKVFLIIVLVNLVSISLKAQSFDNVQVTNDDEILKKRVRERVALMNSYITFMADKKNNYSTRQYYKEKSLPLFIGKGYLYTMDGVVHDGVLMQTTSTNTNKVTSKLIRKYFGDLINLTYSNVKVTSTSAMNMKVSDLKKINTDKYVCTCQYVQYFYGYRDGSLVYRDRTTKRIECIIEAEDTEDGREYIVQLGDVEALHTDRI